MKLIDSVIAGVSPSWAVSRARARLALAAYESAEPNRYRKTRTDKRSANAQNLRARDSLMVQARHLEQNFDIASGALDVLVANTIGQGIQPEPQCKLTDGALAVDLNRELLELWDDFIYAPEVTMQLDYYSLQRMVARSWYRDGECFGQRLTGTIAGLNHGTIVPYSLEALEADFCPVDLSDASKEIVQGVEVSAWGRPRAYHIYKSHPFDGARVSTETKRVDSTRMMHVKFAKRLHQYRGVSVFASVINRLEDIKEIDESERIAARVAAAMTGYIKKGDASTYEEPTLNADGEEEPRQMEFDPGMIFDNLKPGEDVGTISSNRPNNQLIAFRDSQVRAAASGIGASYSSVSKNYNGTYSAQRQELVEQFVQYRTLSSFFVYRWCQPVWDGFVDAAIAARIIKLPKNVDMRSIYNATHTMPPMPWIDPKGEAMANQIDQTQGYKSRSRIIRERGLNPDQINLEIQRDQQEADRLGLKLGEQQTTNNTGDGNAN